MLKLSVVIPTQRRPEGLQKAVTSILRQEGVKELGIELIVADNDAIPSSRAAVEDWARHAPFPVVFVHEPNPGVANVRNAAMKVVRGEFIAFLDDDEEAPPNWLASMMDIQQRIDADAVFGEVKARVPEDVLEHRDYLIRFFSRLGPDTSGPTHLYFGCGNSLIRRSALPNPEKPFDVSRNTMGGEDDLLFSEMNRRGAKFGWTVEGFVWEDPIPSRLNLKYTISRAFAYGQGPTSQSAACTPPDWLGVARWMVIGLGQSLFYGAWAAILWLTGSRKRAEVLDLAARGLGKLCWWSIFKIKFYGRST